MTTKNFKFKTEKDFLYVFIKLSKTYPSLMVFPIKEELCLRIETNNSEAFLKKIEAFINSLDVEII